MPLLRRAIACFSNQTYQSRELVVIYEEDDLATRNYLLSLNNPVIQSLEVPVRPKLSLGALRNLSLEASQGDFVAQWDDDDWHGPTRLEEQIKAVQNSDKQGCVLLRWIMYDELSKKAYVSGRRAWEGSLLARRSAVPLYSDLTKGEDTGVIRRMINDNLLVGLENPALYIYTYHGANTWEYEHWQKNLLPYAAMLTPEDQEKVSSLLHL